VPVNQLPLKAFTNEQLEDLRYSADASLSPQQREAVDEELNERAIASGEKLEGEPPVRSASPDEPDIQGAPPPNVEDPPGLLTNATSQYAKEANEDPRQAVDHNAETADYSFGEADKHSAEGMFGLNVGNDSGGVDDSDALRDAFDPSLLPHVLSSDDQFEMGDPNEPSLDQYPFAEPPVEQNRPDSTVADTGDLVPEGMVPQRHGNGDETPNEYGDGSDLDGNRVPDEIGINPDILQPGYPTSTGSALDSTLFDPDAPGPILDPNLFDPHSPGPTLDSSLFDLTAPGPTLDPSLFDPHSPGPTLDPALLDPTELGPTLDPALLDPSAPGETIDPAQLEQLGTVQPDDVPDPAGVTNQGLTDPTLTDPGTVDQDIRDHDAFSDGI
jgi:hypothetical protein